MKSCLEGSTIHVYIAICLNMFKIRVFNTNTPRTHHARIQDAAY